MVAPTSSEETDQRPVSVSVNMYLISLKTSHYHKFKQLGHEVSPFEENIIQSRYGCTFSGLIQSVELFKI